MTLKTTTLVLMVQEAEACSGPKFAYMHHLNSSPTSSPIYSLSLESGSPFSHKNPSRILGFSFGLSGRCREDSCGRKRMSKGGRRWDEEWRVVQESRATLKVRKTTAKQKMVSKMWFITPKSCMSSDCHPIPELLKRHKRESNRSALKQGLRRLAESCCRDMSQIYDSVNVAGNVPLIPWSHGIALLYSCSSSCSSSSGPAWNLTFVPLCMRGSS